MQQQPPNSEPLYVISVAARLAGLPCWVLRVLDQEEIVVPARTDSNRRLYSDQDIAILARVRHLTEDRGVNINGVKVIFEIETGQQTSTGVKGDGSAAGNGGTPGPPHEPERPDPLREPGVSSEALALVGRNSIVPYNSTK